MQFIIKENIDSSIFGENFEMDFYDEKGIYKINKYALTSEKAYIKTMEYSEDELNG
ncbi:hypothetical protein [Clostridium niameyense]|uniref:hypothetical protein n=1 Tax=Clostridium niameyense TaxID=1622073 RepID=UPI0013D4CFB0|nr:hypothetical protein [Clostridium niameyense]